MKRRVYSVELGEGDRDALMRVAAAWSVRRADAIRLAIRVLAEAVDAVDAATAAPLPAPPDGAAAPSGQGVASDH